MASTSKRSGKSAPGFTPELGDRIKRVIDAIGSQKKAAELVGVRPETVGAWQRGEQKPPFLDMATLCRAAHLPVDWLASGRDSQNELRQIPRRTQPELTGASMLQVADPSTLEANALVMVPLLDVQAAAGSGRAPTDSKTMAVLAFAERLLREAGVNPRFAHVIQVSGQSMYPTLNHEDLVLIDTSIDQVQDEELSAVTFGNNVRVKRVRLGLDGSVTLSSDNKGEGHSDIVVKPADLGDLHIAGRVCGRVTLRM